MQVICGVALGLRGIVVTRRVIAIRIVISHTAEERLIRVVSIFANQELKLLKVIRIAIIFFDHVDRDCLPLGIGQKPLQHIGGVNTADGLEKPYTVIRTCSLQCF